MSGTVESIGSHEVRLFQPEFSGESISFEQKGEWLNELLEYGIHIIPCGSPHDTVPQYFRKRHPFDDEAQLKAKWAKTPRVNWSHYQRTQPSDMEVKAWHHEFPAANWAAITGINFAVVDADSDEAMAWISEGNITRSPLTQRTPRGGAHYFYSIAQAEVRTGAGKNKIDTRGVGGYVMVAPSLGYTMHCEPSYGVGSMDDLPPLTDMDISKITAFNNGGDAEPNIREVLNEDAAEEGGRNDKLARLVGKWIKEGWGMREILIKAQDWNQTCDPPLSIVETATTTLSICQGHIKRHPEDIDAGVNEWETSQWQTQISEDLKQIQDQEDPVEAPGKPEIGPLGLVPFSDQEWQEETTFGQIEQYWGDAFVFQNSRVLLLGKPKIGKSNFLGAFAAGACTGTDFLGVPFSKPLKVMWFQAEIIKEFMKDRIETYFRRFAHDEDMIRMGYQNLIVSGRLRKNLMTDQDIQAFHEEIQYHKPDIVMIDPIINFFDGEENSNTEIRKLLDRIDRLIELNNVAVLLAHHTGKERADDKSFMSARGGSVFAGWFDSGIKLAGEKPNVQFYYEARNARDPDEHLASFDFELGEWQVSDLLKRPTKQISTEDEVEIADIVFKGMQLDKYYKRGDMELLAKKQLRRHNRANGQKACRNAVSYLQSHLGHKVLTYSLPGQAMWHYLAESTAQKPWEVE